MPLVLRPHVTSTAPLTPLLPVLHSSPTFSCACVKIVLHPSKTGGPGDLASSQCSNNYHPASAYYLAPSSHVRNPLATPCIGLE